ncbi:hypothetical protein T4D_15318 [Trichinella pseudospiralis]|uniref:Uncharacterized protein n=1 Tax=Trichinella pseudospiralis TaxID=6337 RepID=A0A0V1F6W5_TRIPS|nr:hypothetical protein T4D_15318 [Trichinella pseudospiralis]
MLNKADQEADVEFIQHISSAKFNYLKLQQILRHLNIKEISNTLVIWHDKKYSPSLRIQKSKGFNLGFSRLNAEGEFSRKIALKCNYDAKKFAA